MTLIRTLSDIHYEMGFFYIEEMPNDKETILVIAGDLGLLEKPYTYVDFITEACDRFKQVIWVYGNHCFYRGNWPHSHEKAVKELQYLENLHFGYEFIALVDNVAFVCSTLWTDFNDACPLSMMKAKQGMNDFRIIRTGSKEVPYLRKFDPIDAYNFNQKTTKFIKQNIIKYKEEEKKVVVITHHQPSSKSIHQAYIGDDLNGAYVNNLDDMILETKPNFWLAGHVHNSFRYNIGETEVIVNPVGYPQERNRGFDPKLIIEL